MVTAKKVNTPKAVEAAVAAPVKTVAAKKPAAKKAVPVAKPVEAAPVAVAPVAAMPVAEPAAAPVKAKAPAKAKAVAKPTAAPVATATVVAAKAALSSEQRNNYVKVAAFYIAERRAFAPGNPADDWAAAEAEVDRLIASGQFGN
jgi:hypothetical protein